MGLRLPRYGGDEGKGCQNEDEKRPSHRPLTKSVHGIDDAASDEIGGEEARKGRQADEENIGSSQDLPASLDHDGVEGGCREEPRDEGRVFNGIPGPVAAPSEFHVRPPRPKQDARGKEGPGKQHEGARGNVPRAFAFLLPGQRSGEGQAGRDGKAGVAEEEQRRMNDHAGILQERVEAASVSGHGILHGERIAPNRHDEAEKGNEDIEKGPEPQLRFTGEAFIVPREGEDRTHDRYGQAPEEHGPRLAGPEGGEAVEEGEDVVRVTGHVVQTVILPVEGVQQKGRSHEETARDENMSSFNEGGDAVLLLPEMDQGRSGKGQGAEKGREKQGKSEIVHLNSGSVSDTWKDTW